MQKLLVEINKAALTFLIPSSLEDTYVHIIEEAVRLLDGDDGMIVSYEHDSLKTAYASSTPLASIKPRKKGFSYEAITKQKILIIHKEDPRQIQSDIMRDDVKAAMFIPLTYKNKSNGVVVIRSFKHTSFRTEEQEILKLFGAMASLAIQQAKLHKENKRALELRDFFIALAAQELRTPLTTINGYVSLLKSKLLKKEASEAKWVMQLSMEMGRLTNLVHDLLELNRIKAGKINYAFGQCNLEEVLKRSINNFSFAFPQRTITYINSTVSHNVFVIGDFDKLMQVIIDILENAAKFSPSHTPLGLTLAEKNSSLVITIEDHGKGIEKSELPYIFEGFYKPNYMQEHGMGIGLFMAKNIIEHHNGTIEVNSHKKVGTIVRITLPKAKM